MNLIPVIAQDARTNDVLMLAWTDAEALRRTKKTGYMHYWSRSRKKYWKKGVESGHVQKLVSLHYDCDKDTILARVIQEGPACRIGRRTAGQQGEREDDPLAGSQTHLRPQGCNNSSRTR